MPGLRIYDVSLPIQPGMVTWPGDAGVEVTSLAQVERDGVHMTRLAMGVHTGTHVDSPLHFIVGGRPMDAVPLETLMGPCHVVETDAPVLDEDVVRALVASLPTRARIVFKTRNSARGYGAFYEDFVHLTADGAAHLATRQPLVVGMDYLSVGAADDGEHRAHHALLGADVVLLEGLVLAHVPAGTYDLVALPLPLVGVEASPVRAVLIAP